MARRMMVIVVSTIAMAALLGLAGCGGDSTPTAKVTASEWLLQAAPTSAKNGQVKFTVDNVGGFEHELVIVQGSDPKALPTKADGSVDEDQIPEAQKVGEVENVAGRTNKSGTFAMQKGTYVLFCNLSEKDGTSHFAKGMSTTFTVT
jgi:hypothetical protein